MRPAEQGFLLLGSTLGNPNRKPLTAAQLRTLAERIQAGYQTAEDRELQEADLRSLGYGEQMARRILDLLSERELLRYYLRQGQKANCVPLTRISRGYPGVVRQRLALESPACLWARGDLSILEMPRIGLVGSRELLDANRAFAAEVGRQAAAQGYALVSGNARGADRTAQEACLAAGGKVISVVADELKSKGLREGVLYLSEEGFDMPFSAQRAISRNRVIHCLGQKTFVAQCGDGTGGTWDGTVKNLRRGWSPVYVFADGSSAMARLDQLGAQLVLPEMLESFENLPVLQENLFDQ